MNRPVLTLSDLFVAVMTGGAMHQTRCQAIKLGYGATLPPGHLIFYSDADDPSLPAYKVISPRPKNTPFSEHQWAQKKWVPALIRGYADATRLGTTWTLVADDDTFVIPRNVLRVLQDYDGTSSDQLVGQQCGQANGMRSMCGGAGWAMSASLHKKLANVLPACADRFFLPYSKARGGMVETQSDRFLGRCFKHMLRVPLTDRPEFNSQPPLFYETSLGRFDRPRGYGRAATFHYVTKARLQQLVAEATDAMQWKHLEHLVAIGQERRSR